MSTIITWNKRDTRVLHRVTPRDVPVDENLHPLAARNKILKIINIF